MHERQVPPQPFKYRVSDREYVLCVKHDPTINHRSFFFVDAAVTVPEGFKVSPLPAGFEAVVTQGLPTLQPKTK